MSKKEIEATLHTGHRKRLRARMQNSLSLVDDYELLEYLFTCVHTRRDTKPLAKRLCTHYKTLSAMVNDSFYFAKQMPGMGDKSIAFCEVIAQIVRSFDSDEAELSTQPVEQQSTMHTRISQFIEEQFPSQKDSLYLLIMEDESTPSSYMDITNILHTDTGCLFSPMSLVHTITASKVKGAGYILVRTTNLKTTTLSEEDLYFFVRISRTLFLFQVLIFDYIVYTGENMISAVATLQPNEYL